MGELRLVGVTEDGHSLLLADESGDQHTISIDERLRAGVNGHLSRLGQLTMALESRISPREIQERVRAGESAEHVAITAGVPLERVLRFVGPVLREREHVAEQARRARLAGSNGPSSLLSDLVGRAAARQGADPDDAVWDSARREDHSWVVTVSWPDGTSATWALDVMRHQATPLDAPARTISGLAEAEPEPEYPDFDPAAGFDAGFDASGYRPDDESRHNVRAFTRRPVAPPRYDDAPAPYDADEDDDRSDQAHLAELDESSAQPHRSTDDSGGPIPAPAREDDAERSSDRPTEPLRGGKQPRASRSSRRARVPTWDDIMFGPKSKD